MALRTATERRALQLISDASGPDSALAGVEIRDGVSGKMENRALCALGAQGTIEVRSLRSGDSAVVIDDFELAFMVSVKIPGNDAGEAKADVDAIYEAAIAALWSAGKALGQTNGPEPTSVVPGLLKVEAGDVVGPDSAPEENGEGHTAALTFTIRCSGQITASLGG